VAYREKPPAQFLAEVLGLVRDMDYDVEVEVLGAEVVQCQVGGGSRAGKPEELRLCEEWTHQPRLAMAEPHKLCRLASQAQRLPKLGAAAEVVGAAPGTGASGRVMSVASPAKMSGKRGAAEAAAEAGEAQPRVALGVINGTSIEAPLMSSPVKAMSPRESRFAPLDSPGRFERADDHLVMCGGGEHANAAGARSGLQVMRSGGGGGGGVAGFSLDASAAVTQLQVRRCKLTGLMKPVLELGSAWFPHLND